MRTLILSILLLACSVVSGAEVGSNSTTSPLANGSSYTGEWQTVGDYSSLTIKVTSDQAGILQIDFSNDCITEANDLDFVLAANIPDVHRLVVTSNCFRVYVLNNSGSDQTVLTIESRLSEAGPITTPFSIDVQQDSDALPVRNYSELEIMVGGYSGNNIISKYARNPDVDAAEDIWNGGGDYTGFPTTSAEEFQVFSSSTADTVAGTGAQTVRVYYYNSDYEMVDSSGNFLYFDVTLNGTTAVNSGITGIRIWRAKVLTSGSGQVNAGNITIRWRTTTAAIFAVMPATYGQTAISNFTIPSGYTGYIKRYSASMDDNSTNRAELAIKVRDFGSNTFRLTRSFVITTDNDIERGLYGGIELSEKTDLVFRATSVQNANGIVSVSYELHLVKN